MPTRSKRYIDAVMEVVPEDRFVNALRGKPNKFRVGQRVRLSVEGRDALIRPRTRRDDSGVVTKVDEFNSPSVLWEGRKRPASYYPGFIEPDRRRTTR